MSSDLKDWRLLLRFGSVNVVGLIADYVLAVLLSAFGVASLVASTIGFTLGSAVNYVGHSLYSYEHTSRETLTLLGFARYFLTVILSLIVRLVIVFALERTTALEFWLILLVAIAASFVTSFVAATLWAFKKP